LASCDGVQSTMCLYRVPGLGDRPALNTRNAWRSPMVLFVFDPDRAKLSSEALWSKRCTPDTPTLSLLDVLERVGRETIVGELDVKSECCGRVGDVVSRIVFGGVGTGRGFMYLSAGLRVRSSELVEPTLALRWRTLLNANGTSSTFTS
jgi:hypothetical protein